jgi:hypothetical protein
MKEEWEKETDRKRGGGAKEGQGNEGRKAKEMGYRRGGGAKEEEEEGKRRRGEGRSRK